LLSLSVAPQHAYYITVVYSKPFQVSPLILCGGDGIRSSRFSHTTSVNATLVAIAEDPIEFAQFCGDKDALCNPLELDIHTDARIQDVVLKLAFETILGVRRSAKADVDNDDIST